MQAYSNPERETDDYSLPDIEVFHSDDLPEFLSEDGEPLDLGWYWWSCFPGCLPNSDPFGPFETEQDALEDAQDIDVDDPV
jgi:hypothetical protein